MGDMLISVTIPGMEPEIRELVEMIHDRPGRVMLVAAGAGTQALAWLLGVAGASRTLLEALIPYDENAFINFLGRRPDQHVADSTAGLLAGRAINRASFLNQTDEPSIGLACTATIVTDRPKRGQHRAHISVWTAGRVNCFYVKMKKGARQREGEEGLVSRIIINALAQAMGIDLSLELDFVDGDNFDGSENDIAAVAAKLHKGNRACFGITEDGHLIDHPRPKALLSGSFNPLHEGHLRLADVVAQITGHPVLFELAALNAEKGSLEVHQTLERLIQFAGNRTVIASRSPTFNEKARLYPGAAFIVGVDTAERVLQPKYYGGDYEKMLEALAEIKRQGCRFLVAGRLDTKGIFQDGSNLKAPTPYEGLFKPIPQDKFRLDLSSTDLRNKTV